MEGIDRERRIERQLGRLVLCVGRGALLRDGRPGCFRGVPLLRRPRCGESPERLLARPRRQRIEPFRLSQARGSAREPFARPGGERHLSPPADPSDRGQCENRTGGEQEGPVPPRSRHASRRGLEERTLRQLKLGGIDARRFLQTRAVPQPVIPFLQALPIRRGVGDPVADPEAIAVRLDPAAQRLPA